jgi:hypothetical protein
MTSTTTTPALAASYPAGYNASGRLYGMSQSLTRLADLMDTAEDPLATLVRLVAEDIQNCAAWVDECMTDITPHTTTTHPDDR